MEILSLNEALRDPPRAAQTIERELLFVSSAWGFHDIRPRAEQTAFGRACVVRTALIVVVRPTARLERERYPSETIEIVVDPRGEYFIRPIRSSAEKPFKHRNGDGTLCLEMPKDPPERRWSWSAGLQSLVFNGARHMWFEEFHRRTGEWPVEDAPHGHPSGG